MKKSKTEIHTLSEYQKRLTCYEQVNDHYFLPGTYIVIRLDAHRHDDGWKNIEDNDYPFGEITNNALLTTARRLFSTGTRILYAFVHGDEISLFLDPSELSGLRRRARIISGLASAAAAEFFACSNLQVLFHAKVCEFPNLNLVKDYFLWQRLVATRNYLSRSVSIELNKQGASKEEIGKTISNITEENKREILKENGIKLEKIPNSLLYGSAFWWDKNVEKLGPEDFRYNLFLQKELHSKIENYAVFLEKRFEGPSFSANANQINLNIVKPEEVLLSFSAQKKKIPTIL